MRDRLVELQQKAQELSVVATENTNPFSVEDDDDDSVAFGVIKPQAVVFEEEPVIQDFLSEVEHIQDDIAVLETEVLKFTQQQKTMVATMRRFSVMKKESSITRDIKLRAESLHRRLDNLSKQVQKTMEQQGPTAALTRIQSSQHAALLRRFQQVMREYNEGLLTKQERCKHFIIRQLEVSGKPVTEEEVDEMVATGNWEVFNENLLNDVRITRTQLSEIEQRHKELLSLENNMKELRDLFMDIFMLVEEQGVFIEHIQTNVEMTQDYVVASNEKFKAAARYKKRNPIRQLCCCCCPPWRCCL
ncbi:syntaxin-19 [Pundamilia nyererei]|uniref:Syntaxin-19 n=3 Tax=Haplochromini TaxID=319058 RepID=A0A3B4GFB4_9CICH|nr:PREDICTED: syntaxin-19 [Pundamilia nyererei]XP_005940459.1 syntaxin-19 [Haplochromis burtoni]XP_013770028.1 PREDICTED: syntaxin-19 [Pundamilia nyererei]XP_026000661.1 syntaxin-19 [Astatotilapia calliptera]XP_026000662.1 syntaxin-19 [Astatotilapia calliptera]XP_039884294.1 syntaxin-19 [Simochromis diagramma]XP_042083587.1 syntaxin-19 [Haplochromis burtoni]